jgi:hypothetical protein
VHICGLNLAHHRYPEPSTRFGGQMQCNLHDFQLCSTIKTLKIISTSHQDFASSYQSSDMIQTRPEDQSLQLDIMINSKPVLLYDTLWASYLSYLVRELCGDTKTLRCITQYLDCKSSRTILIFFPQITNSHNKNMKLFFKGWR